MKYTQEQIVEAFDAAIEERGEEWVYPQGSGTDEWHVYGLCRYVKEDGAPACVWGVALNKVDPELVPSPDDTEGIRAVFHRECIDYDNALLTAATWAQIAQDRGMPYGKVKLGFHRVLALTANDLINFDIEEDMDDAGYPDPTNI